MDTQIGTWEAFRALPAFEQRNRLLDTMALVVGEAGQDYVYPRERNESCKYVRNGEPSCLIGRVLARLGVPLDTLARWDPSTRPGILDRGKDIGLSPRLCSMLAVAQDRQDEYAPWGECLRLARES